MLHRKFLDLVGIREVLAMSSEEKVLAVLAQVTEVEEVKQDLDLRLYDLGILDSMKR